MVSPLSSKTVVVVGAGRGIGRGVAQAAAERGAHVVAAGRFPAMLAETVALIGPNARTLSLDLQDETSIADGLAQLSGIDHIVTLGSAHAHGKVPDLAVADVQKAFQAKVFGPLLLLKHAASQIADDGSVLLFSGVAAWRPVAGQVVMATANGAVASLTRALSVELAPTRVNAIAPGIVDSGAWDRMGEKKDEFLAGVARRNPVRRVGTVADIVTAALLVLENPFITGEVLHVDGGARLA